MIRRPPRSTRKESSAASDVYKRQVLDGTTVRNSMVFVSYRVTTGTLEGRREVRGARRAVITSGPLNGVEIDPKQAMGNSVILGSVTIVLDANFQDDSCPLARIKKGLEMFVLPRGGEQLGELSTHPGDRMYSVNGRTGTCLLYTSPSPRDATLSRMPSSA